MCLVCAVCCEPFIKATTLGCSHTFCEECVRRTSRQTDTCPLCRAPIATSIRSLVIDDAVDEWVDGLDEASQRARRQLVAERRRAGAQTMPTAQPAAQPTSAPRGRTVTTVVTYE
ncbi:E3 ubiquitin-protein ligase rnf8-A-like [Pollicipes pollicipes]|uniref:E3 ubiquitin-protein ligase rnf8-A-like n=1 Tax=Pollicipes pollicipes TaxID=41117 RepID=UPI001884DAF9|nr:E3 ubiquitin-protein ligase rnf8-A-like [Pollicipes pollicipes]XP_037094590.1 E3 ubiquitin-protein ligase rnf8-A-like [Pollicipes pollicipes]